MKLWEASDRALLNVTVDTTTYCNAGCPQCHRTNPVGLGKADWLPLIQWDLDTFKKAFPKESFRYIGRIAFVPTWGDAIMCKEIFDIVKYVIDNSLALVSIETNGSIRDEDWWWEFGIMGGERLTVRFDVDGVDQEMHSKYRRFTDLDKVLNNMFVLSQTKANAATQTVVFKHNQDYLDEIEQICIENGTSYHTKVISDRFENFQVNDKKQFVFTSENGKEEYLERADQESLKKGIVSGTSKAILDESITCRWAKPRNEVTVMPNGQVVPCCYHGNTYFRYLQSGIEGDLVKNPHFKKYMDKAGDYNIFNNDIIDIINSEWFTETLPNSFTSDNPIPQCLRQCSSKIKKVHQIRETHDIIATG